MTYPSMPEPLMAEPIDVRAALSRNTGTGAYPALDDLGLIYPTPDALLAIHHQLVTLAVEAREGPQPTAEAIEWSDDLCTAANVIAGTRNIVCEHDAPGSAVIVYEIVRLVLEALRTTLPYGRGLDLSRFRTARGWLDHLRMIATGGC